MWFIHVSKTEDSEGINYGPYESKEAAEAELTRRGWQKDYIYNWWQPTIGYRYAAYAQPCLLAISPRLHRLPQLTDPREWK